MNSLSVDGQPSEGKTMKPYQFLTLIMLILKCTGAMQLHWVFVFLPCMIQPFIWLCAEAIKRKEK